MKYPVLLKSDELIGGKGLSDVFHPVEAVSLESVQHDYRGSGEVISVENIERILKTFIARWTGPVESSDSRLAFLLREELTITRRDAADKDLWTCLNSTIAWPYVVWRWEDKGKISRARVSGGLDRSALARLWWMAEFVWSDSESEVDQALDLIFEKQDRAVQLYERSRLVRRRKVVDAIVAELDAKDWSEKQFRILAASVRSYFGVRLPDLMSKHAITHGVSTCASRAREKSEVALSDI